MNYKLPTVPIVILVISMIVSVIIIVRFVGSERRGEIILTSLTIPTIVGMILFFAIDYNSNKLEIKNKTLEIDDIYLSNEENEKKYSVEISPSQGSIKDALYFIIKDSKIECKEPDMDMKENCIRLHFEVEDRRTLSTGDEIDTPNPFDIPDIEQLVIFFEDFNGNIYYKYLIIVPGFDFTDKKYVLSVDGETKDYDIVLKHNTKYMLFDVKFMFEDDINNVIKNIPKNIDEYLLDQENKNPLVLKNGGEITPNPKIDFTYKTLNAEEIKENVRKIIESKMY